MDPVSSAIARAGHGLVGNANHSQTRQVTLIEREVWETLMRETAAAAPPSARRANLMVSGISLAHTRGRVLCVGRIRLRIGGETRPCERMDEAVPGLLAAMRPEWRGGVYAQVLDEGKISIGDQVSWVTTGEG